MIRKLLRRIRQLFWLLPCFLLWAVFPPMGETMDVFFALAPLLWLSRNADVKTSVRRWFVNGFVFWFATLAWMPAIVKNGGPWPLVVLGWGALSAYCALYFGAFGYLSAKYWAWAKWGGYGRRIFGILLIEPILWAGLEIVRSRFGGGFAWNQLGVAAVNSGFGFPAALGGVYLLSALVILINGTLASIAERMVASFKRHPLERWRSIETLLPILIVLGVFWAANARISRPRPSTSTSSLKVAMIQRNFPCCFKSQDEDSVAVYSNLMQNVALLKPDLIVLPESAMAEFGAIDGRHARAFADWLGGHRARVLAGGGRSEKGKLYNSAAIYNGHLIQIYDKVHLVPFGEFIPGDKWIPALQKLAPVGSCTPGELKVLGGAGVTMGVAICFEDTDSAQMRQLARMGAQLLVFITNDSWFSHSDEAIQHAWQARARAIETGLPVVRVGNSGVTGTIQPNGDVAWLLGEDGRPLVDRQGTMFDRIQVENAGGGGGRGGLTPYVILGDAPLGIVFVLLIGAMILVKYKHYAKRRALSM